MAGNLHDYRPTNMGRMPLLRWTQETLTHKARVSLTALKRLESEDGPCPASAPVRQNRQKSSPYSSNAMT